MDDPSSTNPEVAPSEEATRRGLSQGTSEARPDGTGHPRQVTTESKRVEFLLRIVATEPQQAEPSKPISEVPAQPGSVLPTAPEPALTRPANTLSHSMGERKVAGREVEPQQIPARMLNEFVYCQRLFYYEFVEGALIPALVVCQPQNEKQAPRSRGQKWKHRRLPIPRAKSLTGETQKRTRFIPVPCRWVQSAWAS